MLLIGEAGTLFAVKPSNQWAAGLSFVRALISSTMISRFLLRAGLVAKRSSPAMSGAPMTSHISANCVSLPTAMMI